MNWNHSILLIVFLIIGCKTDTKPLVSETKAAIDSYLINVDELLTLKEHNSVKIIDFRRAAQFKQGHIAEALNIWRSDVEDSSYVYSGMIAKKEQLETLFRKLGIHNNDLLVVYDNNGSCDAARFWWVMQHYGYNNVKIFNGGLAAWIAKGNVLSKEIISYPESSFSFLDKAKFDGVIDKDMLEELLKTNSEVTLIDTRTHDEFTGKRHKKGANKAGRIPKSKWMDWVNAINYGADNKFKSIETLERLYGKLNAKKTDTIIVYCHTGVRSAHTYFVLKELLGYENVMNYDGSWTEWSHFDELPFKQDSLTKITK